MKLLLIAKIKWWGLINSGTLCNALQVWFY